MNSSTPSVRFVTADSAASQVVMSLSNVLPFDFSVVSSIQDLFSTTVGDKRADLIVIDINSVFNVDGANVFDIINSLPTLIDCFYQNTGCRKKTKIAVMVDSESGIARIKEILETPICGLYPKGLSYTLDEKHIALSSLVRGEYHIPKKVKRLLSAKSKIDDRSTEIQLTPRQEQVLTLIRDRGASNKVIAKILKISESTVKLHVAQVFKKFCVKNRTQLVVFTKDKPI